MIETSGRFPGDGRARSTGRWHARVVAGVLLGVLYVGAAVVWGLGWTRGRAACDQYEYHLRAILKFAAEWPRVDVRDYLSATTPGYHLVMAGVARYVTENVLALQVVASVMTAGLLMVLARGMAGAARMRGREWMELVALALPVVASPYVFTSGAWLLPDNAGWMLALVVGLNCARVRQTSGTLMFSGLVFAVLMLVRQSHVWAVAPIVMAGWLATTRDSDASLAGAVERPAGRVSMTLVGVLVCVPGVLILAAFARMWHGLTPPTFQTQHVVQGGSHINWATPPFILALIGVFSPFYMGWVWPGVMRMWRESRWGLALVAIGALAWAAVPATTFLREPRSGGLWSVVDVVGKMGMDIGGHSSPVILLLAPIGAVMLAGWLALLDDKRRWVVGGTVAAFVAAQSANANCWQRYHEPFLLMMFALVGAGFGAGAPESGIGPLSGRWGVLRSWRIAGPVALAVGLAAITVGGLKYGRDPLRSVSEQVPESVGRDPGR